MEGLLEILLSIKPLLIIGAGIIILFILLRIFKTAISLSFIGFICSIVSYFWYDYYIGKVPVIASIALLLCFCGYNRSSAIRKIFSILGFLLSIYIILLRVGII